MIQERPARRQIILEYAKWTALSAARVGSPIRSKNAIYPLLDEVAFDEVLNRDRGAICAGDFDTWHEQETLRLCDRANDLKPEVTPFPVGWSAKLINVFLKTAIYVGDLGRDGMRGVLHPPIDSGLRTGLKKRFGGQDFLKDVLVVGAISHRVRLFFVDGPISLSGGGEAGGNWIRQGVVRSGGGSGGRRYFCRQRPMGDFRWSSRAS